MKRTISAVRGIFVVGSVIGLLVLAALPASADVGGSVRGGGAGTLAGGPFAGDRVQIEITARHGTDGDVTGRFHFAHHRASGELAAELSGVVTCLAVGDGAAHATGIVTDGQVREAPGFNPGGQTVAISILEGTPDQAGFDLSFFPGPHTIPTCETVTPFVSIDSGNFTVSA